MSRILFEDEWLLAVDKPAGLVVHPTYKNDAGTLLDELRGQPPLDLGYDLIPRLVGRARVLPIAGYFRDIGTVGAYRSALEEWPAVAP